ncbi:ganglioside-induced differentiation-associated protein 1-like [Glandiceps talaboti]
MAAKHSDEDLVLYYEGNSYHCHRVLLALEAKHLRYRKQEVDVAELENLSPDYMKLNPSGDTPTLVHGVEVIVGAEKILHYVDEAFQESARLYPEETSKAGRKSQYLLKLSNKLDLDILMRGVPVNQQLAGVDRDDLADGFTEEDALNRTTLFRETLPKRCDQLNEEHDDLKEEYQKKKEWGLNFPDQVNIDELDAALKMTNDVIAKLEDELTIRKIEEPPEKEWWLIGIRITITDIYWASNLCLLENLGLARRYWSDGKRPHVAAYLNKIKQHSSFKAAPQTKFETFVSRIKTRWPWIVPVGVAVAGVLVFLVL